MNRVNEIFAERLKELREEKGLSLKELARKIGVSDVAIGRWERKVQIPNIVMLDLIAKYFNVSPNYLLGYEN
ncbi:MAG: helix-turn-helix domain-containing protein [Clostridia bacterium]